MKKNIKWEDKTEDMSDAVKISRTHFEFKDHLISVINGFGTYDGWAGSNIGFEEKDNMGLLEIMIDGNEPQGWLKAEDVIKLLEEKEDEK